MEHCDGVEKIENLLYISQTTLNAPYYAATCDDGFVLLHRDRRYECRNQEWVPALRCVSVNRQNEDEGKSHRSRAILIPHSLHEGCRGALNTSDPRLSGLFVVI